MWVYTVPSIRLLGTNVFQHLLFIHIFFSEFIVDCMYWFISVIICLYSVYLSVSWEWSALVQIRVVLYFSNMFFYPYCVAIWNKCVRIKSKRVTWGRRSLAREQQRGRDEDTLRYGCSGVYDRLVSHLDVCLAFSLCHRYAGAAYREAQVCVCVCVCARARVRACVRAVNLWVVSETVIFGFDLKLFVNSPKQCTIGITWNRYHVNSGEWNEMQVASEIF